MDNSALVPKRRWRSRRNQSYGSLMISLRLIKGKFYRRSAEVSITRTELHDLKTELCQRIAEVQAKKSVVINNRDRHMDAIKIMEAEVQEARNYYTNLPPMDKDTPEAETMLNMIEEANFETTRARNINQGTDFNINIWRSLISRTWFDSSQTWYTQESTQPTVLLPNIDPIGTIGKNGSIKIRNTDECCICATNGIDSVLLKCGHQCCCSTCADELHRNKNSCPVCRASIKKIIKTFRV